MHTVLVRDIHSDVKEKENGGQYSNLVLGRGLVDESRDNAYLTAFDY